MDGKKFVQTQAIMNYIGATFNLLPSDLLLRHKGEKICAYWMGDVVMPHIFKGTFFTPED